MFLVHFCHKKVPWNEWAGLLHRKLIRTPSLQILDVDAQNHQCQFTRVLKNGGLKIHWRQLRVGSSPSAGIVIGPNRNRSTANTMV